MSYKKFIVEEFCSTPSGNYAIYKHNGTTTWTTNYGYQKGDVVEVWDHDGYAPSRIDVNGVTIWTEKDKRKFWKNYDPDGTSLCNPYNQNR